VHLAKPVNDELAGLVVEVRVEGRVFFADALKDVVDPSRLPASSE